MGEPSNFSRENTRAVLYSVGAGIESRMPFTYSDNLIRKGEIHWRIKSGGGIKYVDALKVYDV